MLRKLPFSVLAPLLAAVGCARHSIPPVVLIDQSRFGPAEDYGPGIIAATRTGLEFVLDTSAQVIVLRVTDWGIEPVHPRRNGRPDLEAGPHNIAARTFLLPSSGWVDPPQSSSECVYDDAARPSDKPVVDSAGRLVRAIAAARRSYEECQRRERTRTSIYQRTGSTPIGGSTPVPHDGYWLLIVSDAETKAEDLIGRLELHDMTLEAAIRRLPAALVGNRTRRWAAYYAAFGEARIH